MSNPNWTDKANRHSNRYKAKGAKTEDTTLPIIKDLNGNYPDTQWDITRSLQVQTVSPNRVKHP